MGAGGENHLLRPARGPGEGQRRLYKERDISKGPGRAVFQVEVNVPCRQRDPENKGKGHQSSWCVEGMLSGSMDLEQ